MKKKLLFATIVLSMILSACAGNVDYHDKENGHAEAVIVETPKNITEETIKEETTQESLATEDTESIVEETSSITEENAEPDILSEPEVPNESSYAMFKVSEEWANLDKTKGMPILDKGNNLYSCGMFISANAYNDYNVGWRVNNLNSTIIIWSGTKEGYTMLLTDSDLPVYSDGDLIRCYGFSNDIIATRCEFAGYTIPVSYPSGMGLSDYVTILDVPFESDNLFGRTEIKITDVKQFEISHNDTPLEDYRNIESLEKNDEYIVSWFKGTDYNERVLKANCRNYKCDDSFEPVTLEATLNKAGYATYDLSSLPKGIYLLGNSCLIEKE